MPAIFNPTVVFFILGLSGLCFIDAHKVGFSVQLIHRDSPKSPFYNASETTSDRAAKALRRSFKRVHHFNPSSVSTSTPEAYSNAGAGEYLMKISIGTPAFDIVAIADTGSDLIWTQCQPCPQCFKQDAPLFNPSDSSTYKRILCNESQCSSLEGHSCSVYQFCQFSVSYEDKSSSKGEVAADRLALPSTTGHPVVVPRAIIGCGQHNSGTFDEKTSGIIGLGSGTLSLISQLGSSIDGKFSYCLSPLSIKGDSSKMHFGSNANVLGAGVVSTPLTTSTHYFLTLEAVSVGKNRINFTGSPSQQGDRNIIIDSGTTYTILPKNFYSELESAVSSQINARRATAQHFSLCYEAQNEFTVPDITVHFTDADVKLQPFNTFHKVSETVSCFAFISKDTAIYGNLAQMNFLVGYDTKKQTVSFKPTDCSMT